ncbi:DNA-directed RNA polymerase subunit delta [Alkalicoccus saliphilus]|jgi:DNA-directed RNA polymerase subunit delta|uniref:Probable DNA-directed RNA polymerase subunit delta n=1 Tax=Alkalicoccus saliphilus TaxID=200989 RepID=A0A2T4U4K5_9BACI|nr:DNA-directed RNA polymerase subunit delta [Alkalicoccus saliphilus]PTL38338.1 DNA-directed RNA polymerase subunit delta [Alkalicoccus saliphilus]
MSLKDYTEEQLKEISMIEVTFELLEEKNSPEDYGVLINRVSEIQGLSKERRNERIAHLYTQMSLDGRFVNLGDNRWALRSWYPFEQTEEELSQMMPKRRKAAKEEEGFDDELEEYDEFEDIEDELDELANEDDTDVDELPEDEFGDTSDNLPEEETEEDEEEEK